MRNLWRKDEIDGCGTGKEYAKILLLMVLLFIIPK